MKYFKKRSDFNEVLLRSNEQFLTLIEQLPPKLAKKVFKIKIKENPNYINYHNYGVFLTHDNLQLKGINFYFEYKQGFCFLKKSFRLAPSYNNSFYLGSLFYTENSFREAENFYYIATQLKNTPQALYNLAASYFMNKNYQKSYKICIEIHELIKGKEANIELPRRSIFPFSIILNTLTFYSALRCGYNIFKRYSANHIYQNSILDTGFLMAYEKKNYKLANHFIMQTLSEKYIYEYSINELAIMVDSTLNCNNNSLFFKLKNKYWCNDKKYDALFYCTQYRKKLIHNFTYIPELIEIYNYIDSEDCC